MSASLEIDRKKLIAELDARIAVLKESDDFYASAARSTQVFRDINQREYNKMTADEQKSKAGEHLKELIQSRDSLLLIIKIIRSGIDDQIEFLNEHKDKVNQAFLGAIASIRKDYGTSGGPGNEIYQNDNFYFT